MKASVRVLWIGANSRSFRRNCHAAWRFDGLGQALRAATSMDETPAHLAGPGRPRKSLSAKTLGRSITGGAEGRFPLIDAVSSLPGSMLGD